MDKLSKVILNKLTEIAIEKGYNPKERGAIKMLVRNYLESKGYEGKSEVERTKELNTAYRSFKNFFKGDIQFTSDTLDAVLDALDVKDITFKYDTVK